VLHGTVSNPDGTNALVTLSSGEKRITRGGGQPFAGGVVRESVRGVGESVIVSWPSGLEQSASFSAEPVQHIDEPQFCRVWPRHVVAGAADPVEVEVDPAAAGAPGSPVEVTASAGAWSVPMTLEGDGVWRGELLPPAEPGTLVLTIRIGETMYAVRPRIFVR
jgi:hypothetical protein